MTDDARTTADPPPVILVVAYPSEDRARIGGWLEDAGFEVMTCRGPRGPHPCIGMRGHCPLAEAARAVVLDACLEDDPLGESIPAWQVLDVYLDLALPVVVLADAEDRLAVEAREGLVSLPRAAHRDVLVEAAGQALRRGLGGGGPTRGSRVRPARPRGQQGSDALGESSGHREPPPDP